MSPLSAALISNRSEDFQLLLDRGADINGVPNLPPRALPIRPLHVPVCAAADIMAGRGTHLVQACLDHGADINFVVRIRLDDGSVSVTTPLLAYLRAVLSFGG